MQSDIHNFKDDLLAWYDQHGRDLPWRHKGGAHPEPYHVWLSEIMLQQTTVQAVKSYFEKFTTIWPRLHELANADEKDVMDAWAGLGYYSRARNLHKCARELIEKYDGRFPKEEIELLKLPGIGPYTASAIRSIAFNLPANVVDGNVERIMARVHMIEDAFPTGKIYAKQHAAEYIEPTQKRSSDYVQSLMDLGAVICTPKSPKCPLCPVKQYCKANKENCVEHYPKMAPKKAKPKRYGTAYIVKDKHKENVIYLERRPSNGLLANMLGFPTSEWTETKDAHKLQHEVKHVFTHFELYLNIKSIKRDTLQDDLIKGRLEQHCIFALRRNNKLPTLFKKVLNKI